MTNIFILDNINDFSEKINIDDLYEKKKEHDLKNLELFNKLLHRVHVRIKTTSRLKKDEQFCWFVVPELIIGVPKYDQGACIAYLMNKLIDNGFNVRYINPNTLLISWHHWIPSYIRNELKKKTGISINEFGVKQVEAEESPLMLNNAPANSINELVLNIPKSDVEKSKKEYKSIKSYRPSGNLIYDNSYFDK